MTYTKEKFTRDEETVYSYELIGHPMTTDDFHTLVEDDHILTFSRVTDGDDVSYVISRNTLDYDCKVGNWDETLIGRPSYTCPKTVEEVIDFLNETNF